jgi:glycosyltransferase involved in cell wall biosynthesis
VLSSQPHPSPQVAIGLPVYNGEAFLCAALDSFLAQTYSDFEMVICDNASTDRTEEIARAYVARDSRFRYHRNDHNIGLGPNHNRVFELTRAPYFKWAAADDICRPDYVEKCVGVLESDPGVVLVYPKTQFMDRSGAPLDIEDPGWDLRTELAHERLRFVFRAGHWVNSITGLIRRDALAKTRLMPTYPGGDYRLLAELSLLGKFHEIPERLFLRRLHPQASSQHGIDGTHPDRKWLVQYWNGANRSFAMPAWRLGFDQFRIILGSPLSLHHKLSLVGTLFNSLRWKWRLLGHDLCSAAAACLGLGKSPPPKPEGSA